MLKPTIWLIAISVFVVVVVSTVRITDDEPGLAAPTTIAAEDNGAMVTAVTTSTLDLVTSTLPPTTLAPGTTVCDPYESIVETGIVASPDLVEASGLAVSRTTPDVLWSHNDSRDSARLYAMNSSGEDLGGFGVPGAFALDWEDIAAGPGADGSGAYLYVGDIGDNFEIRSGKMTVYRVPDADPTSLDGEFEDALPLPYRYPDGVHNAEAMFIDPVEPALYVVTKLRSEAFVYRGSLTPTGDEINLEHVGTLFLDAEVSGGDISWDGSVIALRGYQTVWMWHRPPGATVAAAFASEPCIAPAADEEQGESIAFDSESGYWTVSEGSHKTIYTVPAAP